MRQNQRAGSSGSITIFFVVMFLAVLILTGAMIDVCRILVAENKVDSAIRASTKSMASDYHETLAGAYGLFGVELDQECRQIFTDYMKTNLEYGSNGFLSYSLDQASVRAAGAEGMTMDRPEVFREQVEAYMKLKGTINSSQRHISRLAGLFRVVGESGAVSELESRKNQLDKLEKKVLDGKSDRASSADVGELRQLLRDQGEASLVQSREIEKRLKQVEGFEGLTVSGGGRGQGSSSENAGIPTWKEIDKNMDRLERLAVEIEDLQEEIEALEEAISNASGDEDTSDLRRELREARRRLREVQDEYEEVQKEVSRQLNRDNDDRGGWFLLTEIQEKIRHLPGLNVTVKGMGNAGAGSSIDRNPNRLFAQLLEGRELLSESEQLERTEDGYYLTEYVMDRFTYATGAKRENSVFQKGEAEYVLSGHDSQTANLIQVGAELFLVCYAIDVIDLHLEGVPLWPAAVIGGVPRAAADLRTLYSGGKFVPFKLFLTSRMKDAESVIGMQYSDLLYLKLILQERTVPDLQLLRVKNIVDLNISPGGKKQEETLAKLSTVVETEASVKVNLMFLPMLPLAEMGVKGFEGSEYTITKTYRYAYQAE